MTATRKVYLSKDTLTIATGGTLVLNGTLSGTIGCAAPATLAVTGAATVGTTLNVVGDFSVATNKFVVTAATGLTTIDGGATNPALKITGAGSVSGTTAGTAYTSGAPAFAAAQLSARIYIGTTPYRVPLWADA